MTNHEGTNHLSAFAFGLMFHRSWDDGKEHCGVVLLTVADPELRETDENYLPRLSGITRSTGYFLKRNCGGGNAACQLVLNALRTLAAGDLLFAAGSSRSRTAELPSRAL